MANQPQMTTSQARPTTDTNGPGQPDMAHGPHAGHNPHHAGLASHTSTLPATHGPCQPHMALVTQTAHDPHTAHEPHAGHLPHGPPHSHTRTWASCPCHQSHTTDLASRTKTTGHTLGPNSHTDQASRTQAALPLPHHAAFVAKRAAGWLCVGRQAFLFVFVKPPPLLFATYNCCMWLLCGAQMYTIIIHYLVQNYIYVPG